MKKILKLLMLVTAFGLLFMSSSCSVFGGGPKAPQCPSHSSNMNSLPVNLV